MYFYILNRPQLQIEKLDAAVRDLNHPAIPWETLALPPTLCASWGWRKGRQLRGRTSPGQGWLPSAVQ